MQITYLNIKNFKSIRQLEIRNIENSLILVGKNNTGKTVVLDAIRAVTGNYIIKETDFNEKKQKIEIAMTLSITEEDLHQLHAYGLVSSYKRYELWKEDFCKKLPSFSNGELAFIYSINQNGKVRYMDNINGFHKNNHYIKDILPKIYYIDAGRNLSSFQEDLLMFQKSEELVHLRSNTCIFDSAKICNHCFSCIGLIHQKKPEDLNLYETAKR